jgi:two-component system, response regulator PdtaR
MKPSPESPNARILIVEDEAIVAADLEDRLEQLDYRVVGTASSGEEALRLAAEHKPDLVLSDIMIQGEMDGTQAAVYLRQDHNIPVIFLTAYSSDSVLQKAKISGPFGYLLKPFEERELQITIEMGLYKHKMELERERLVQELQEALAKVKTLSGLLPICSSCKKIRDDTGYWSAVETYVSKNSEIRFSHGLCPDCAGQLYPGLGDDAVRETKNGS